jgi:hypothetical protein
LAYKKTIKETYTNRYISTGSIVSFNGVMGECGSASCKGVAARALGCAAATSCKGRGRLGDSRARRRATSCAAARALGCPAAAVLPMGAGGSSQFSQRSGCRILCGGGHRGRGVWRSRGDARRVIPRMFGSVFHIFSGQLHHGRPLATSFLTIGHQ